MTSYREIVAVQKDAGRARALAQGLCRLADMEWTDWELDFLTSMASRQQELTRKPIQLRLVETLPSFVCYRQRLGQHAQPFSYLPNLPMRLGQQGKKIWPYHLCPGGLVGGEALVQPHNPLLSLSPLDQRPPLQESSPR